MSVSQTIDAFTLSEPECGVFHPLRHPGNQYGGHADSSRVLDVYKSASDFLTTDLRAARVIQQELLLKDP